MQTAYMDAPSAKLAVELQLEDVNSHLDGLYDSPPEGDELAAFETTKTILEGQLQILAGSVAALNILKDQYINRLTFTKLLEEEKQAVADHQLAIKMGGLKVDGPEVQSCAEYEASLCDDKEYDNEEEQWQLAKKAYAFEMDRGRKSVEEVKNRAPVHGIRMVKGMDIASLYRPKVVRPEIKKRCNACSEHFPTKDTLTLRCSPEPHTYCRKCLVDLFNAAIVDTTLFPPRCCKIAIPLNTCRTLLSKQMIQDFDSKVEELATPNPTYCSDPGCSVFIRLANITHDIAKCACGRKTCVVCKAMEHGNKLCPDDPHVQLLMDVAKRSKWQQCRKCNNMVELATGCYHMKCRCTYEFCYLCGLKWNTCGCPLFNEAHLLYDGPGRRAVPPVAVPIAPPVAPENDVLEPENDGNRPDRCGHGSRRQVDNRDCEECGHHLAFVMQCRRCDHRSCWRCINNRT